MTIDKDKLFERIRKLLAMAADTSSPNEAAIAARRARKLMDDHQLSLDDLKGSDGFAAEYVDKPYRFMPVWKSVLSAGIAKINDCRASQNPVLNGKSYAYRILFQGYELDVRLAVHMYDYLVVAVERLCKAYMDEISPGYYLARLGDSFKKGAAGVIQSRLYAMHEERKTMVMSSGTSLVLFKMAAVENKFGKHETGTARHSSDFTAHMNGQIVGESISLDPQVTHRSSYTKRLTA